MGNVPEQNDSERHINKVSKEVVASAIEVHRNLGPGLLESAYEAYLAYALRERGLAVEHQKPLPVVYRDVTVEVGYRLDLLVENAVVVELKSVERLEPIHQAQLLSYLKLSGYKLGLLINFNVRLLKHGIKRIVNKL
ncbi:MAG: GxxExxY protein [Dehalococcoidia bacterium]|nr:GxxExxY protein [Dehalococcoidia bacterium]